MESFSYLMWAPSECWGEGITEAAGQLRLAGFIRYRRGHISVLQRLGLETRSCECYAVLKKEWGPAPE